MKGRRVQKRRTRFYIHVRKLSGSSRAHLGCPSHRSVHKQACMHFKKRNGNNTGMAKISPVKPNMPLETCLDEGCHFETGNLVRNCFLILGVFRLVLELRFCFVSQLCLQIFIVLQSPEIFCLFSNCSDFEDVLIIVKLWEDDVKV